MYISQASEYYDVKKHKDVKVVEEGDDSKSDCVKKPILHSFDVLSIEEYRAREDREGNGSSMCLVM